MNTRIKAQDWFGIRFCSVTTGSKSLRDLYEEYAANHLLYGSANAEMVKKHLIDSRRRHYLLTAPALEEIALLPVKEGFDFGLLDSLPTERGCLLISPTRFIRYHVTTQGLSVLDLDAQRNPRMVQWGVRWAEGTRAERNLSVWPLIELVVQTLAFLHLSEPEFTELIPKQSQTPTQRVFAPSPNETAVTITRVGKGWNYFLLNPATGQVRGHVRIARVGKGWQQRRLVQVRPHERTRMIQATPQLLR
jgi:hypothetical protein